ncbi:putative ORFan [Tupanvirus deep ocean]|uniref:ORFan n=2 Tax=Tupanvirus TaxID=2094720 RepID=A0AC62A737_9VIRU|nr:putative ORFan [Tupanvirus deep ocean]QKU33587.1 putative ORFan [Tupanvirus deep ocean]
MEKFPIDFCAQTLESKNNDDINKCLSKYRQRIYSGFKYATSNYFEVPIDNDYSEHINYLMIKELHQVGFDGHIITRTEEYIVGGENDPETRQYTKRFLIITVLKN